MKESRTRIIQTVSVSMDDTSNKEKLEGILKTLEIINKGVHCHSHNEYTNIVLKDTSYGKFRIA